MTFARTLAGTIGGIATFVLGLNLGLVAHINLQTARRFEAARVNAILAAALSGRVTIERIGGVGLTHVSDVDAHVDDVDGTRVLRVVGVSARVSTLSLLRSLFAANAVRVGVPDVSIEEADANLDTDGSGSLRLARAFTAPTTPSTGPSRGVVLAMPRIRIDHAKVHGRPDGAPAIDADVGAVEAALREAPGTFAVDVAHASVVARRLTGAVGMQGELEAHVARPSPRGRELGARVAWRGTVGRVSGTANGSYEGGEVTAVVDVTPTTADDVRALWEACPFAEEASAHVEVRGTLPDLEVDAHASVGHAAFALGGPVTVGDRVGASFRFNASNVDAHALAPSAPTSNLSAAGEATLGISLQGNVEALFDVDVTGGSVGAMATPPASLHGSIARDAGGIHGQMDVAVREPGAPTDVSLRLAPKGNSFVVTCDAAAGVAHIEAVPRFRGILQGRARATAHGTLDVATGRVDAQMEGSATDLAAHDVRLREATWTARARGPLAGPWVDADVRGEGLEGAGLAFATARLQVHGSPTSAPVQIDLGGSGTEISATGDVGIVGGTTIRNANVSVEHEGVRALGRASLVQVNGDELHVDDASIDGFGAPLYAAVRVSRSEVTVHAEGRGVDLARVARFAHRPNVTKGRVSIDADAVLRASGAQGHLELDLADGTIDGWSGAQGHVDATLDGRRVSGHLRASVADVGSVELQSTSVEVGGAGPLAAAAWRRAWGAIDLKAHVDLAKLWARMPVGVPPFSGLSGIVDVSSRVERDSADDVTPDVEVRATTSRLVAVGPTKTPWRVEGIDATVHVRVDGRTGFTAVDGQLADRIGAIVVVTADSDSVPYAPLFMTDQPLLDIVRAMPFAAKVVFPARDLASLPPIFGTRGLHGDVKGRVDWKGALDRPVIDASVSLERGQTDVALLALPLNVEATAHYDGIRAVSAVRAISRGAPVLEANVTGEAIAADVVNGLRGAEVPWRASAHAKLTKFPLHSLAALDERQVHGHASGEITLDDLHDDARATVALQVDDLRVIDVACRAASLRGSIGPDGLEGTMRIDEGNGFGEGRARVGVRWGAALAPSLDPSKPADLSLSAKRLRAELLLPFVSRVFAELDGRIDANAELHVDPDAKAVRPEGTLSLHNGVFQLASMGGEFHDAQATLTLTPDGIVRLTDATAKGLSGKLDAAATARFTAGAFAGARGVLLVPKQEALPLIVEGVQLGAFDGEVSVAVDPVKAGSELDVNVKVPSAHVQLPLATSHDVQDLGEIEGVRKGYQLPGSDFVPLRRDPEGAATASTRRTTLRVAVQLGGDVEVKRGTDLDVRLEGTPTFVVDRTLRASGQIRLIRGFLDVQGKKFSIENGTVTFVDDPANPQVKLTASWQAPDGTVIYAVFSGALKSEHPVTLRSDPARSQTEILSLILFGTTDSQNPSSSGSATSAQATSAVGAAGGAATAPINRALGGVNQMLDNFGLVGGISTKVDTSQPTPRPEVELQIARDISLQIAWVLGSIPPGTNPDTTLFTLDWRFLRKWSLETTVGDAGTSILDLVWQHRY